MKGFSPAVQKLLMHKPDSERPVEMKFTRAIVTAYLVVALIVTTAGQCQTHEQQHSSALNSFVEWVVPAVPTNHPQTPEEEVAGRNQGRKLPSPEILQPTLDSKLRDYRPVATELSGRYRAAASDVLPGLVQQWIAE